MSKETMDRGSDALQAHLSSTNKMEIRQTRRGWCQELLGCEARTEFKYFNSEGTQIAHSLEDANCCCRFFCISCHPFTMQVKELNTEAELLTVDRPCALPPCACKCCCYQTATVTSGGQSIGDMRENCYFCIPQVTLHDGQGHAIYKLHPPTCCGGCCVNPCTEGNPCFGRGCCKVPYHVFPADQAKTGGDAPYIGKILKKPKSMMTEVFTDADAFEVTFPENATTSQKALLVGTSIFINALFFEQRNGGGAEGALLS